jgi:hypothetical protein
MAELYQIKYRSDCVRQSISTGGGEMRRAAHLRPIDQFWVDVRRGNLPSVSIVAPDFNACSDENPKTSSSGRVSRHR